MKTKSKKSEWRTIAGKRLDLLTKAEARALKLLKQRDSLAAILSTILKRYKIEASDYYTAESAIDAASGKE